MRFINIKVLSVGVTVLTSPGVTALGMSFEIWSWGVKLGLDFGPWSPSILVYYPKQKEE